MTTGTQGLVDRFEGFYREYYREEAGQLAQKYPDEQRSLWIDWGDLYRFDRDLAEDYLAQPDQLREYAEEALRLYDLPVNVSLSQAHVRVRNLSETTPLDEIRSRDVNTLIEIRGTVKSISPPQSIPIEAAFECQRCGTLTYLPQSRPIRKSRDVQEPHECQGCERQGPFRLNQDQSTFVDEQTLLVQEELTEVGDDEDIESIVVELKDDLVEEFEPGDHLAITGVLRLEELGEFNDGSLSDKRVEAHSCQTSSINGHLTIPEEEKRQIIELSSRADVFERLVESFAPTVYGHEYVKKAIVLQLVSGVEKELPTGPDIRGDIHILLVGDPGTGKSVLLRRTASLSPRAVKASGKETTAVGITAAATPSGKGHGSDPWFIEGGILVIANGGLACIDDFTNLSPEAMAALHGVLEHQEINLSKATQTKSLTAKTSILAAGNPKYGRFDQYEPIGEQIEVDPGLVSQFDLIFAVSDNPDETEDSDLADHILETNYEGELYARDEKFSKEASSLNPSIPKALFRKYIAYSQQSVTPVVSDAAREKIKEFYVKLRARGADEDAPLPITARKLEGLVRLAEASARVRLSDTVEIEDAERVVDIVRASLVDIGVDPETGQFDADVIETGTSKTQRDRIKNIRTIVSEIQDDYEECAPVEEVLARAVELGIDESKAEHEIERLRDVGELYEPLKDCLRTT